MKHDRNLLKAKQLPQFRVFLDAAGFEVRDGKGDFEVLQVKVGPNMWAVINRNAQGELSTHPELRTLINRFKAGPANPEVTRNHPIHNNFKAFHRSLCERFGYVHDPEFWWRDTISLEEHIASQLTKPAPTDSFLEDLRDDFAMRAMQGYLANSWQAKELDALGESSAQQMATVAEISYAMADAMLKARKA